MTDGVERWYFRRKGEPKVRLPGTPYSPEFMETYYAAREGKIVREERGPKLAGKDTLRWLERQ